MIFQTGNFISHGFRVPYPTPWGPTQACFTYVRGVHHVTTAGHGGFLIAKRWAEKNLSPQAIEQAQLFNNYYCFEEDCAAYIPLFESVDIRRINAVRAGTNAVAERDMVSVINQYFSDYFKSRGINPNSITNDNI